MAELAAPRPLEGPNAGLLSRAVSVRLALRWELVAFASVLVIGAGLRFWDLGARALHHDESLHGYYSWVLYSGHGYVHDPLMHGPFQFFGMALTFLLTGGATDYTLRVFPALFGTILIALPFFLRSRLGSLGALFASALIAFSPTLLYFSRFAREDIYAAVFALALVVALWRYLDTRKPLYLYLGAFLLALHFATKENSFLTVGVLLLFLNIWLAVDFARQTVERTREGPTVRAFYTAAYFPFAWAFAALWPFIRPFRENIGLRELHPAGDFLIVLGTLSLPQLAAMVQALPHVEIQADNGFSFLGIRPLPGVPSNGAPIVAGLLLSTALVGLSWRRRDWAIAAACFYVPYIFLYTSFLTHPDGFGSGMWNSLNYWLQEQRAPGPPRGNQPFFYYFMLMPVYEFLPLILAAPALFYYAIKGDEFRRFLVFWPIATFAMYILAGEKMPWLSVHTTVPVVILAGYVLGQVFSRLPDHHRLQRIVPEALPFAAAALGLAAIALAAFGPAGAAWVAMRIVAVAVALASLVWLMQPLDRRRLAVGVTAAVVGALSFFTLRSGIEATFEHGDVPRELLVYTQTSPQVPDIMDRIDEASRVSGLGKDLPVFIDTTYAWPWHWYLRDYRNVSYGSAGSGFKPADNAVVIVAVENEASMQPYLDQYQAPIRHPLRWWFPEFDTYKTLPTDSVFKFTGEFVPSLFRPSSWDTWWTYFRDRKTDFALGESVEIAYFPKAYPVAEVPPAQEPPPTPSEPLAPPSIDDEGRYVLGQAGAQPGAFGDVSSLAVDADGNVYVADTGNHRVQKFDVQGKFVKQVGGAGTDEGKFNQPADIAIDAAGNLYVADTWNHRIQVLNKELEPIASFGKPSGDLDNPKPGEMWGPRAIEIAADGNLLVADSGTNRIRVFSPQGENIKSFGKRGEGEGEFQEPVGLAVMPNGDIWVADVGNARLQRFDRDFKFIEQHPVEPWSDLDPANKPYLALLPDGRLLASDGPGDQVLVITQDGTVTEVSKIADVELKYPRGVAVDGAGFGYISEPANGQVLRFPLSDLD